MTTPTTPTTPTTTPSNATISGHGTPGKEGAGPPARVTFLGAELGKWDQLDAGHVGALILSYFSDERPLRGAAGLCDWRLCGRLSRLLAQGRVTGAFLETTLYPATRLPFGRLLLVGLGEMNAFDEKAAVRAATHVAQLASKMGLNRYAVVLPGRSAGLLSARRALSLFLEAEAAHTSGKVLPELLVVESSAGQKEAADLAHR